jgi:hypothetical protein
MAYTCCFIIPIKTGVLVISVLGVLASAAFGVVYAIEIQEGMMTTPDDAPAAKFVPYMSMGSWMLLAIISLFGCVASWTAKPRLASIYFWSLLAQYIFDFAFLTATVFFCVKSSQNSKQRCVDKATAQGFTNVDSICTATLNLSGIILLVVLGLYKLYSTYTVFAIFRFKRWAEKEALAEAAQKVMQERPQQQWKNYDSETTRNWSKFDD